MRGKNNFMLYLLAKFGVFMLYLLAKIGVFMLYLLAKNGKKLEATKHRVSFRLIKRLHHLFVRQSG